MIIIFLFLINITKNTITGKKYLPCTPSIVGQPTGVNANAIANIEAPHTAKKVNKYIILCNIDISAVSFLFLNQEVNNATNQIINIFLDSIKFNDPRYCPKVVKT